MKGKKSIVLAMAILLAACTPDRYFDMTASKEGSQGTVERPERIPENDRSVMIMVSGGKNSLSSYLKQDLEDLAASYLPTGFAGDNALVVLYRNSYSSATQAPPVLYKLYKDIYGNVLRDTLKVWPAYTPVFGNNTLEEAMNIIKDKVPAKHYGIVLSSHASGYLPDGYYSDPSGWEQKHPLENQALSIGPMRHTIANEVFEPLPAWPAVKSIGQDMDPTGSVEMELRQFKASIPYHLDYILFDACLMAGIETAYELRDKADYIGFSPTEIMADGFDYSLLTERLLKDKPDPVQVCRDYIAQYKDVERRDPWATISIVRTDKVQKVADVARDLFEKYRTEIAHVNPSSVQRYYRSNYHFFYDFRDILSVAGVPADDLNPLDQALEELVVFKDHTEKFMSIPITRYSGLSMYLPKDGSAILSNFYKNNTDWNAATELVK